MKVNRQILKAARQMGLDPDEVRRRIKHAPKQLSRRYFSDIHRKPAIMYGHGRH